MTIPTLSLADPTNFGNKPGDGPLRPGGKPADEMGPQAEENLPSTPSKAAASQWPALTMVRDLVRGPECVREKGPAYLPQNPGEKWENYSTRLARSVFHNYFRRTAEGLTGLVFRTDPHLGDDVPAVIRTNHWENLDNAGTHGDVFCRSAFFDALTAGHNAILVEYPKAQPGATLADEEPLRPYWILIQKDNIMSWRSEIIEGREVLVQIVLREETMVPNGKFGEKKQTRYRVLRNSNGLVSFELLEVLPDKTVAQIEVGLYRNQSEIPLAEIITSGRIGLFQSIPPLLDVAYLNVAHYQQWSDYATSIHMTCVPILFGAGVPATDKDGKPIVVGPNTMVTADDPNAQLDYKTHNGAALMSCRNALEDLKNDMGTLGLAMLTPQKRMAETAEAKRIDKTTGDSSLAVAARGLQDAIEKALYFHARYLGLKDGGSVEVNRDFEGMLMEAPVMTAYAALVRDAGFPPRLVLEMLQRGGRLPENVDLDDLELQMAAEMAALANIETKEGPSALARTVGADEEAEEEDEDEEVAASGNPYKVVKRGKKWVVVKADSGEVVKAHPSKQKAVAHFRALEANVKH